MAGSNTITLALAFIVFNMIMGVLIGAFASEGVQVGTSGNSIITVGSNISASDDIGVLESKGWFSSYLTTVNELPLWMKSAYTVFMAAWLILIGLFYARGI